MKNNVVYERRKRKRKKGGKDIRNSIKNYLTYNMRYNVICYLMKLRLTWTDTEIAFARKIVIGT